MTDLKKIEDMEAFNPETQYTSIGRGMFFSIVQCTSIRREIVGRNGFEKLFYSTILSTSIGRGMRKNGF